MAGVAAAHCRAHFGSGLYVAVGQVACGACWERAIRDDERFVVQSGLARELDCDPEHVDEVAVERACTGERVGLTPVELVAAVGRLHAAGHGLNAIAERLGKAHRDVAAACRGVEQREGAGEPTGPEVGLDGRDGLGVCESCRCAPAVTRVTFTDHVVFAVCAACAAGAIAEDCGGGEAA